MAAGSTYTPIATTTLGSAATSITLSSISGSYTDLVLVLNGIYTATNYVNLKINNDGGSNYSNTLLGGNGSSAYSNRNTSVSYGHPLGTSPYNAIIHFQNYSNTTTNKTSLMRIMQSDGTVIAQVNLWRSSTTAPITRLDLNHDSANGFNVGTTVTLYGIQAA